MSEKLKPVSTTEPTQHPSQTKTFIRLIITDKSDIFRADIDIDNDNNNDDNDVDTNSDQNQDIKQKIPTV